MRRLQSLWYWLSHGFTLPRAWHMAKHPLAPQTPAWKVWVTAIATGIASLAGVIALVVHAYRFFSNN